MNTINHFVKFEFSTHQLNAIVAGGPHIVDDISMRLAELSIELPKFHHPISFFKGFLLGLFFAAVPNTETITVLAMANSYNL